MHNLCSGFQLSDFVATVVDIQSNFIVGVGVPDAHFWKHYIVIRVSKMVSLLEKYCHKFQSCRNDNRKLSCFSFIKYWSWKEFL